MLSTLIELQRLKRLDRTGWTLRGLPNGTESVAAHSFGVGVTAMPVQTKIVEKNDDSTTMRLTALEKNQKISQSEFEVKLDSNVKIVKS